MKKYKKSSVCFLFLLLTLASCTKKAVPNQENDIETAANEEAYLVPIEEEASPNGTARAEAPLWVSDPGEYNPEPIRTFDLQHTKLELRPIWETQRVEGVATLLLKPWFYEQSVIILDAKGFEINKVKLVEPFEGELTYEYDKQKLSIKLPRAFTREEELQIEIDYVAKPNELMYDDLPFFAEEHGLYFINPEGKTPNKPRQIWTQGETENNSAWFPTFDQPNVKTTQEVLVRVDTIFETLSNGKLISSNVHEDGTRTDHWKQEKPHAPYLFMLAVGEFAIIKEEWRGKEVSYYVEPKYAPHAKAIFGRTPEMLDFFSEKFGYEYPWEKYAQVTVRDYISGAMENTSATIHMAEVQRTTKELKDYDWDDLIAHELAHHWFGDLVTCESWANLPLNESFATYSEFLWTEHEDGINQGHYWWTDQLGEYLYEAQLKREPLIRYRYQDKEDMFDSHSYAKGALILHLLRQLSGDEAFFETLKRFVNRYAYQKAEIHDLRLVLEEVTGKDWQWFFDQYYFAAGHPELSVYQVYENGQLEITASQVQPEAYSPEYFLPLTIRVWSEGKPKDYLVVLDERQKTFTFPMEKQPELVIFDADYQVIGTIEHEKSTEELLTQVRYATDYRSRAVAIEKLSPFVWEKPAVGKAFLKLMKADFWAVRASAARAFTNYPDSTKIYPEVEAGLKNLAKNDPDPRVRMNALDALTSLPKVKDSFFVEKIADESYLTTRSALFALAIRQGQGAKPYFEQMEDEKNDEIVMLLADYYSTFGTPQKLDWFIRKMDERSGTLLSYLMSYFAAYLPSLTEAEQRRAADYLIRQASENSYFETRKEAFQHLLILEDVTGVAAAIEKLQAEEKDRRVADFQKAVGG